MWTYRLKEYQHLPVHAIFTGSTTVLLRGECNLLLTLYLTPPIVGKRASQVFRALSGLKFVSMLKLPYLKFHQQRIARASTSIKQKYFFFDTTNTATDYVCVMQALCICISFVLLGQCSLFSFICLVSIYSILLRNHIFTSFDLVIFKFSYPGNVPLTFPMYFMNLLPKTVAYP